MTLSLKEIKTCLTSDLKDAACNLVFNNILKTKTLLKAEKVGKESDVQRISENIKEANIKQDDLKSQEKDIDNNISNTKKELTNAERDNCWRSSPHIDQACKNKQNSLKTKTEEHQKSKEQKVKELSDIKISL